MGDPEKMSPNSDHDSNEGHTNGIGKENGHHDEFVHPTMEEESALIRKLDMRLMPTLFLLYMMSVLDRGNLGNAKLAGMEVLLAPT